MQDFFEYLGHFSHIVDVRSPSEYAKSHIPNALNLPIFSDDEFQKIGTIYKQNALEANLLGASIACRNIANLLNLRCEVLQHKNKILLYCARGGNRSLSLFLVLKSLKFQVDRLDGGYKAYRNVVLSFLNAPTNKRFLTLCGDTGCGKSELIKMAKNDKSTTKNGWSVDLESICNHYGSSFGFMAGIQPSVKMFENTLAHDLCYQDSPIILIENESKKLGNLIIPKYLYESYQNAPKILITASLEHRIERIVKMYDLIKEIDFLSTMEKISPYIEKNTKNEIIIAWENGDKAKIAELLLVKYYDKVYKKTKYDFSVCCDDLDTAYAEILAIRDKLIKP